MGTSMYTSGKDVGQNSKTQKVNGVLQAVKKSEALSLLIVEKRTAKTGGKRRKRRKQTNGVLKLITNFLKNAIRVAIFGSRV